MLLSLTREDTLLVGAHQNPPPFTVQELIGWINKSLRQYIHISLLGNSSVKLVSCIASVSVYLLCFITHIEMSSGEETIRYSMDEGENGHL